MNRDLFFDRIRQSVFTGSMSADQVRGTEAILAALDGMPTRHMAYGLATSFGEVGRTMLPVREGYKKTDKDARSYVKAQGYEYATPAGLYGHVYYGRGLVQLTWLRNYIKAMKALGVDFVQYPDRALEPALAAAIMRRGMVEGWFTGKKLSDYLNNKKTDYVNARRIINGRDRAEEIAGYAIAFETALRAAGYGEAEKRRETQDAVPAPAPKNTPINPASRTAQGAGTATIGGAIVVATQTKDGADLIRGISDSLGVSVMVLIGLAIITGGAYAVYARWTDGGRKWLWQKEKDNA
jgi:putative chitinase